MSFWKSGTGATVTGSPDEAYIQSFATIPEGTKAVAVLHKAELDDGEYGKAYSLQWKFLEGDFKGRIVFQRIKAFSGKPEQIQRALNMLKLVLDLCNFKPTHANAPTNEDVAQLVGNTAGIVVGEWSMLDEQTGKMREGNFVREVHPATGFVAATGSRVESAFSRQRTNTEAKAPQLTDEDIPW